LSKFDSSDERLQSLRIIAAKREWAEPVVFIRLFEGQSEE